MHTSSLIIVALLSDLRAEVIFLPRSAKTMMDGVCYSLILIPTCKRSQEKGSDCYGQCKFSIFSMFTIKKPKGCKMKFNFEKKSILS